MRKMFHLYLYWVTRMQPTHLAHLARKPVVVEKFSRARCAGCAGCIPYYTLYTFTSPKSR